MTATYTAKNTETTSETISNIQLGDVAPNFTQLTTVGTVDFHDWAGDSWVVLFSHPKDYTPVCTTELGTVARLKPEFDKRNVKVIGISNGQTNEQTKEQYVLTCDLSGNLIVWIPNI